MENKIYNVAEAYNIIKSYLLSEIDNQTKVHV